MNEKSAENVHGSIKKFTRIMVFIALGFVGLYIFIFMQLKQTESQLTSYGNISDSAIGNFLEKLPESNSIKIERTVDGITFVVKGGEGSSLNADMLDSKDSGYFLNLSNMVSGTLSNDYYDAWGNLESKGYIENGKIKPAYLPLVNSSGEITSISWNDITNKPTIPTPISESQVRDFVSQSAINLSSGSTVNSQTIASQSWVSSQGYLTSIDFSQLTNGVGIYLDYRPNNTACSHDQVLKYDAGLNRWICANDAGAGAVSWGAIGGTLADQTDLQNALNSKLNANATFGGDVTGTYDSIAVSNDSHSHTGATISGLAPSNFSSPNISQWANDAGYLTSVTKSSITNSGTLGFTWNATELSSSVMVEGENISLLTNDSGYLTSVTKSTISNSGTLGFTWGTAELASTVMVEGENISLLNNDAGFLTGVTFATVTNAVGVYLDYRPNNSACAQDQVLKYDAGLNRWICGTDVGIGSVTWGAIGGTLADQTDLQNALNSKLNANATFGGDITGTYDSIAVSNDSHSHTGATISGLAPSNFTSSNISQWANDAGYISGVNFSQIANGSGVYLDYRPNNTACDHNQVLKYDAALTRWICSNDQGAGTISWGDITGDLSDQSDITTALSSKLNTTADFAGDISGTYDNITVSNDSHSHTGATISGLTTSNFTSQDISQWTNNAGYISGVNFSQITNGSGVYLDYRPNNTACLDGQILIYSSANNRWLCGENAGGGGGSSIYTKWDPDAPPEDPSIYDEEFEQSPLSVSWTKEGSGNTTVADHGLKVTGQTYLKRSLPSGDFSAWSKLSISGQPGFTNFSYAAMTVQVDAGTMYTLGLTGVSTNATKIEVIRWNNYFSWHSNPITFNTDTENEIYVSIRRESATLSFWVSQDGISYNRLYTVADPGVNNIGILSHSNANDGITYIDYFRYKNSYNNHYWLPPGRSVPQGGGAGSGSGEVTVGSMTGTTLFTDATADDDWLGLGAGAGRIQFDDQSTDSILLLDANVGIGTTTPTHTLTINGNLGIVASGYINFGTGVGSSGYGIRDNSGTIQIKNSGGQWEQIETKKSPTTAMLVQQATNGLNATTVNITLASAPTEGNILIAIIGNTSARTVTVSQTNVTWTKVANHIVGVSATDIWIGEVGSSPGSVVTLTGSAGSWLGGNVSEWENLIGEVIQYSTHSSTYGGVPTTSRIVTNAGNLVIGGATTAGGGTLGGSYGLTNLSVGGNWLWPGYSVPLREDYSQFLWHAGSGTWTSIIVELR